MHDSTTEQRPLLCKNSHLKQWRSGELCLLTLNVESLKVKVFLTLKINPCGDGLEYLHRSPRKM
jgi:hypothetical protein